MWDNQNAPLRVTNSPILGDALWSLVPDGQVVPPTRWQRAWFQVRWAWRYYVRWNWIRFNYWLEGQWR